MAAVTHFEEMLECYNYMRAMGNPSYTPLVMPYTPENAGLVARNFCSIMQVGRWVNNEGDVFLRRALVEPAAARCILVHAQHLKRAAEAASRGDLEDVLADLERQRALLDERIARAQLGAK